MARATLLTLAALLSLGAAGHQPCVSVRVTNGFGRTIRVHGGRVDLTAEVRVQPDPAHRLLVLTWDYAEKAESLFAPNSGYSADDVGLGDDLLDTPDAMNGALGSSEVSLEGAQAPIRHDRTMNGLSGGTYEVTARVYKDASKKQLCGLARTQVVLR
jgi:hypothetical protein